MLVSVVKAIAGSARRSRANFPTSSAARCCASAALPPFPNMSTCPPAANAFCSARATETTPAAAWRPVCSCSRAHSRKISSTSAVCSSLMFVPEQIGAELLLGDRQRLGDARLETDLHRIILPQRMTFPILGHQQAAQVAVAVEIDPEQVPDLALEPV